MTPAPWAEAPFPPRAWQLAALPQVVAACRGGKAGLVSAVMGAGKSVLIAELVAMALPRARARRTPIIVTAPTRKLVRQLSATIARRVGGQHVGRYYTAEKRADLPVIVACNASVPALVARGLPGRVALWVADEAHGTEASHLKEAAAVLDPACKVGFTATPFRADADESLELWDDLIVRYTLGDALTDKVLVPWDTIHWDGDGDAHDIDAIVLRMIQQHGKGPGIVSARSIEDAEQYAEYLVARGVNARAIHSRQRRAEQDALLHQLQHGKLDALVHVALLAEGVDLPWLRWIALRRRVGSRVRLFQEFGRVLRTCEGKDRAVVMDPYDLLQAIGLSHSASLGEIDLREKKKKDEEDEFPLLDLPPLDPEEKLYPPAVAVKAAGAWSRALIGALEANGLRERSPWDGTSAEWRQGDVSAKQLETLRFMQRHSVALPKKQEKAVRAIIKQRTRLTRGVASDLLSVLFAIADQRKKHGRAWQFPTQPAVCDFPRTLQRSLI